MRPKVVILTLIIAFGLLGLVAVLKGVGGKRSTDSGGPVVGAPPATVASQDSKSASTNVPPANLQPVPGNPVVVSEEMRQALVETDLARIRELREEADGVNNGVIIAALLQKMDSPEPEVRKAVVLALKQMNDTNAIPGLQKAMGNLKDPREKVAVLDAIDYIKAPDIMDGVSPDAFTNRPVAMTTTNRGNGR